MVKFEEKSNGKEVVKIDTCDGSSKARKRVRGVCRSGNKWRARVHHPELKFEINVGRYDSQEEAALAVKKKKAEFQEMFKGDSSTNSKTCIDDFEGRQLPYGVRRRGYRSWATHIFHPGLKRKISLGSYNTPEKAAIALNNKRAEFLKMYGWRPEVKYDDKLLEGPNCEVVTTSEILDELTDDLNVPAFVRELRAKVKRDCNFDDEVLEEPNSEVVTRSGISDKLTCHLKVPCGVRKVKSGKWCARIAGPVPKSRIWLGTFDNAEDAVRSYNKGKAELAAMREKTNKGPINRCPTSVLGSDYLNNISITDKSNGVHVVDAPDKLEHEFVHRSPISIFEPGNSDSAGVGERSMISQENEQKSGCISEFDEAVSLGFINEYGQLMGMYSKLDEQMEFSLPDDAVMDTGVYR